MTFHPMKIEPSVEDRIASAHRARRARWAKAARKVPQTPEVSRAPQLVQQQEQHDHHARDWQWRKASWEAEQEAAKGSRCRAHIKQRCDELGVSYADVIGLTRSPDVVEARHLLMFEIKTKVKPDVSLPEIGRMFGGRDHSTVHHALKKHGYEPGASSRMTDEKIALIRQLRSEGLSFNEVARRAGCSADTVRGYTVDKYRERKERLAAEAREARREARVEQ